MFHSMFKSQFCLWWLNSKCNTLKAATQIQALACKIGLDHCPILAGKLILRCAVAIPGAVDHARRFLSHLPNPDSFMYNALIRGLSHDPSQSFAVFAQMHRRDSSLFDTFTFAFAIKSAANSRSLSAGSQLHCRALTHGLESHIFVATTLVSLYGECGVLDSARKVFDEMPEPNVVAWNAVLTAHFRCGDVAGGEALFFRMPMRDVTSWDIVLAGYVQEGFLEPARKVFSAIPVKDEVSWSTMIVGFAQNGFYSEAFRLFAELRRLGSTPNESSLSGVLSASAQAGAYQFVKILHGFVEKSGFSWNSVNNALLDAYSKCGDMAMVRSVFERTPEKKKNVVSWTVMIAALAMHGHAEEAIRVLREMERSGTKPDGVTYVSILYACSHTGLIKEANHYFAEMISNGIEPAMEHYGCIVDLYGRAGELRKAYEFASEMPIPPNAVIWRTLLGACTFHGGGNLELAEQVRERLDSLNSAESGDDVLLSNAYAAVGKWRDSAAVRSSMSCRGVRKIPGRSFVEVDKRVYSFVAGDKGGKAAAEAQAGLREVVARLQDEGGYVAEVVGTVLHDVEEEDKEGSLTWHSEKLAVAFALGRGERGVIRIVKNLRICTDCHTVMKLVSKVYGLDIVVRDRSRFHSFTGGSCSCKDYW